MMGAVSAQKKTSAAPFAAPQARGPLRWVQSIPGSKSMTNRALILAAGAAGRSEIFGALRSRDTDLMIEALRSLGVRIRAVSPTHGCQSDSLVIDPPSDGEYSGGTVNCGLAGTVMRFLPPLAAHSTGTILFDGDPQARSRPMGAILDALRSLGVDIQGDSLPFSVHARAGHTPRGGQVEVDASGSSQFISGLLLSAPLYEEGITIKHVGATLPSLPHIDMSVAMLREAGAEVDANLFEHTWSVQPGRLAGRSWQIEPDLSNATPFLAAAAVTGGSMRIPNWPARTTQAGDAIRDILKDMGCTVTTETHANGRRDLIVVGPRGGHRALKPVDLDMSAIGELTPTVAALAALGTEPSRLRGIAHLRGHETDRLAALSAEITKLGGHCEELADGLIIRPKVESMHGGVWHSYADHRMATAGAIIGLVVEGVEVEDIATTAKTLPGFELMWATMVDEGSHPEAADPEGHR